MDWYISSGRDQLFEQTNGAPGGSDKWSEDPSGEFGIVDLAGLGVLRSRERLDINYL